VEVALIRRAPEVEALFANAYAAHQQGDPQAFSSMIADDESATALGSAPGEESIGPAAFDEMVRGNAAGRENAPPLADITDLVAYEENGVAWLSARIAFHRGSNDDVPFRGTAVLHLEDGEWKIVQWTVSMLVPDEALDRAWPPA
jgi:ketosteroid isomerase-like protein